MRVRFLRASAAAAGAAALLAGTALAPMVAGSATAATVRGDHGGQIRHVLLLSVNGLHQQDLAWYVRHYPASTLASLADHGLEYSNARTPIPSDSSPGMVAQVTGGDPGVTGIYYDDTWNHDIFPAGTTNCSGPVPGAEAAYEEAIDVNSNRLDAGQGLSGLPGSILQMTSNPLQVINPASLPVSAKTCQPIYPNQYLQVNTIFNVAHAGRPGDCLVGQAPRVPDVRRAVRERGQRLLHPRDQQPGPRLPGWRGLDQRQRRDHAVRQLQGPGHPERDRRL